MVKLSIENIILIKLKKNNNYLSKKKKPKQKTKQNSKGITNGQFWLVLPMSLVNLSIIVVLPNLSNKAVKTNFNNKCGWYKYNGWSRSNVKVAVKS